MSQQVLSGAASANGTPATPTAGADSIRVDVGLLDRLMNLVGELVLARNQIIQFTSRREEPGFAATSQRLNLITTQLQEGVMKTRMQPIGVVWNVLPQLTAELAVTLGKQISVDMDGADTELDKSIIEAIKEPMAHMVRHCCQQGIERPSVRAQRGKPAEGRISLRAFHEGGQVNIEVSDDGAGVDLQQVRAQAVKRGLLRAEDAERLSERETLDLVFLPGVSAGDRPVAEGEGLDIVKTNVERIGGVVDLQSRVGAGATVRVKIPLTLAIIPGLVVACGAERFVIPQVSLRELIRLEGESLRQLEAVEGTTVLRRRGTLLPVARLAALLELESAGPRDDLLNIVVLQADGHEFGLVVDSVQDAQEIVVKPLDKQLKGLNAFAGATIMGDGRVALILDVHGMAELAAVRQTTADQARDSEHREHELDIRQSYLVFKAGSFERLAVPLSLVARLEEFPRKQIEYAGGRLVVQYRGGLLELVPVSCVLDGRALRDVVLPDPVPAVVFANGDRSAGLIVDGIVDILDDAPTVRETSERPGLCGSAVVGKKVTDFLDLGFVLGQLQSDDAGAHAVSGHVRALVADGAAFSRTLIRQTLEFAGHDVIEARTVQEAVAECERRAPALVLAGADLPGGGAARLLSDAHCGEGMTPPAVYALVNRDEEAQALVADAGFAGWLRRSDRDGLQRVVDGLRG